MAIKGITGEPRTRFMIVCATYQGGSSHERRTAVLKKVFRKSTRAKAPL